MIFDVNAWLGVWPFRSLRDNTPEALVARLDRSGIDKAAVSLIEAMFHRNAQPANEKLAEMVAPFKDRLVPMATLNLDYPHWEDDLRACHESLGMKGVRLVPQYGTYRIDGPQARRALELCKERGLPVLIPHRVEDARERHWMDRGSTADLAGIANLIAAVPGATVIVANARGLASTPLWRRTDLREAAWYFDLSLAQVHYVLHWNIDNHSDIAQFVEQGGADHLLFGSHVPFSYPASALVKRAVLPVDATVLEDISYNRAARIFGVQ